MAPRNPTDPPSPRDHLPDTPNPPAGGPIGDVPAGVIGQAVQFVVPVAMPIVAPVQVPAPPPAPAPVPVQVHIILQNHQLTVVIQANVGPNDTRTATGMENPVPVPIDGQPNAPAQNVNRQYTGTLQVAAPPNLADLQNNYVTDLNFVQQAANLRIILWNNGVQVGSITVQYGPNDQPLPQAITQTWVQHVVWTRN
ncbi:hypothetical protein CALCODRAFT_206946 [Calocera cornea HHB12733]|uniref:Uncharacterized protein n=1 Tax=Calocera cornea HHB12733 TaxID=1353952 RepID=A0A165K228_9BASI|nr:hypothetical protein CALCODRAFT_206946 [Calocera cornea HHB12733]